MGNSCKRCFGIHRNNVKYIRSDLAESRDLSIEFENLMTNDYYDELSVATQKGAPFTVASYMKWLSDQERSFMEDEEEEPQKDVVLTSNYQEPWKTDTKNSHLVVENDCDSKPRHRNWCTFGDESHLKNDSRLSDDQLTGYFLDELSRDIDISRDMVDPNKPMVYEEEEIDGPELARLIRKMRPRDLFLTGVNRDILTTAHSSIFIGTPAIINDKDSSHLSTLYTKIHQNLMKGIGETRSAATSERDHSSVDLDWDHEPGMNPSLALEHKRTDTEEDLVNRLNCDMISNQYSYQSRINASDSADINSHNNNNKYSSVVSKNTDRLSLAPTSTPRTTTTTNDDQSPARLPLSPDQMYYNEELLWDLEGEIFSDEGNRTEIDYYSSASIVPSDRCHLLQD